MLKIYKKQIPDTIQEYETILTKAWENNYRYIWEKFNYMWFEKTVKATVEIKEWKETAEWLEFIKLYRTINKWWSYDKRLIRKYEIVLEKNKHEDIIKNLKRYILHLDLYTTKPPLQVASYINWNRFLDDWETVKINYEEKWIIDIMQERKITEDSQNRIMTAVRIWRKTNEPVKEFTTNTLEQMITKIWINKDYS